MVTLEEFVKRFNNVESFLNKWHEEAMIKHSNEIVDMNRKQMLQGINSEGEMMQQGYSPGYAKLRKKKGLQIGFVDMKFTGKFQDSLKGVKNPKGLDLKSNVDYEKYLRDDKYGTAIGLTEENADVIEEKLIKELAPKLKKYLVK